MRRFWSSSSNDKKNVRAADNDGDKNWNNPNKRNNGARPDLLLKERA
jgi:hypothetical protein